MGYNFTGLEPKSEKGKWFQMNNVGWGVMLAVMGECNALDGDILEELEATTNPEIYADDAILLADALETDGSYTLNKSTKQYKPLIKSFAEFCRESGGFEIG
jgi:hypothetical protein